MSQENKQLEVLAKEYADKDWPVKTEEEYYKDAEDEPYYDYSTRHFYVQRSIINAFKAGFLAASQKGSQPSGMQWVKASERLPKALETVWLTNGKGWVTLGCLVEYDAGWHWAESNGIIYEEKGEIIAECESDDLDVVYWHSVPKLNFDESTHHGERRFTLEEVLDIAKDYYAFGVDAAIEIDCGYEPNSPTHTQYFKEKFGITIG